MNKPPKIAEIDELCRHLRNTLKKRAAVPIPNSMRNQLPKLLRHWLQHRLQNHDFIYPGMAKMASWGECSDRQARENFRRLRTYGVVETVAYAKGGRRSTRFVLHIPAIWRFLVVAKLNPSPQLRSKLESADSFRENPEVGPCQNPEENPEVTSAGIQVLSEGVPRRAIAGSSGTDRNLPSNVYSLRTGLSDLV